MKKRIQTTKPYFSKKSIARIKKDMGRILSSGELILSKYSEEFENKFAKYIGTKYAISVNSCTAALEIVLRFFDVKDKEVIVPTNTFVATSNAVYFAGGKAVLCDINKNDLCMDEKDMINRIRPKTKGVIIVHVAGIVAPNIEKIRRICGERGLFLIEDVAHATGAALGTRKAGTFSQAGCFSFYPTKVMSTLIGGMITTDNKDLYNFAKSFRHHGVGGGGLTDIVNLGNDFCLDELRCAIGIAQLSELESMIEKRVEVAKHYYKNLSGVDGVNLFKEYSNIRHVYYKFPIFTDTIEMRDYLVKNLKERFGIPTGSIYYPPCHLQPLYKNFFGYKIGDFPIAEDILRRVLCLPIYAALTKKDVIYIINSLKKLLKEKEAK